MASKRILAIVAAVMAAPAAMQAPIVAYGPAALVCAGYREQVHSTLTTRVAGRIRQETTGREGVLWVRGAPAEGGTRIEAWWDTLSLWRDSPEGRTIGDTDGLLGGRFLGTLDPSGRYRGERVPFLPPSVEELADLRTVLDDFFPRVPTVPLAAGASAVLGPEFVVQRLADSAGLTRLRWKVRRSVADTTAPLDTVPVTVREEIEEEGSMAWDRARGPVGWRRMVTIDALVPSGGAVQRPLRSTLEQRIVVARTAGC